MNYDPNVNEEDEDEDKEEQPEETNLSKKKKKKLKEMMKPRERVNIIIQKDVYSVKKKYKVI